MTNPERDQVAREVAERLGWKINGGGLVEFADGQGGRTSPYPSEAKLLWEALLDKELECRRLRDNPKSSPEELLRAYAAETAADERQRAEQYKIWRDGYPDTYDGHGYVHPPRELPEWAMKFSTAVAEAALLEERKRCVEIVCPRCAKGDPLQEGCHYQETECDLNCGEGEPLMRKERHNYQECPAQKLRGEER